MIDRTVHVTDCPDSEAIVLSGFLTDYEWHEASAWSGEPGLKEQIPRSTWENALVTCGDLWLRFNFEGFKLAGTRIPNRPGLMGGLHVMCMDHGVHAVAVLPRKHYPPERFADCEWGYAFAADDEPPKGTGRQIYAMRLIELGIVRVPAEPEDATPQ